jgi:hypothetical protein
MHNTCFVALAVGIPMAIPSAHVRQQQHPLAAAEHPRQQQKLTPVQRMMPERLKAVHDDAERIRKTRRTPPHAPGLNDYRIILHAHAEDSTHTGGTRPEMLAAAHRAHVDAVLLSDHDRLPRDFIADSWRGLREGVLFVPGAEARGFLLYPTHSIKSHMNDPTPGLIEATRRDNGLIFLSHIEERPNHPMAGLDGMEIYNRHADAKKDLQGLLAITLKLTNPATLGELQDNLRQFPDELFASQVEYPADYLAKWDAETASRRLTGVAANDCHHNYVLLVKKVDDETVKVGTNVDPDEAMRSISAKLRPGIRTLVKDRGAGEVIARVDLDPYERSFNNVSTHILAPELNEAAVRDALRAGHAYVSHDWICDPKGFQFELIASPRAAGSAARTAAMGDEMRFEHSLRLLAQFPAPCRIRLKRSGKSIAEALSDQLEYPVEAPGVYRVEGWVVLGGEERGWIYSNPIYVR